MLPLRILAKGELAVHKGCKRELILPQQDAVVLRQLLGELENRLEGPVRGEAQGGQAEQVRPLQLRGGLLRDQNQAVPVFKVSSTASLLVKPSISTSRVSASWMMTGIRSLF